MAFAMKVALLPAPLGRRFSALVGAVIAAVLLWSASARADSSQTPPKVPSAISQYSESIPTASGAAFPGHTSKPSVAPLRPAVVAVVAAKGGSDSGTLKQIAESSAYGGPQTPLKEP